MGLEEDEGLAAVDHVVRRGVPPALLVALIVFLGIVVSVRSLSSPDNPEAQPSTATTQTLDGDADDRSADEVRAAQQLSGSIPAALLAAELYVGTPSGQTTRDLLESLGGISEMSMGTAEGAFDVVGFDPLNPYRILATVRSSYGDAQNQGRNEMWTLTDSEVSQVLWEPQIPHDFAHFNIDGTITMWVHGSSDSGFAPRKAIILDRNSEPMLSSAAMFASRFTTSGGHVFALTGDGDYYSHRQTYVDLVADDGERTIVLSDGSEFGWIDAPTTNLIIAYPTDSNGVLTVWDSRSLDLLNEHPLAGRSYQRVGISADGMTAVAIRFDRALEAVNLQTGLVSNSFGYVDPTGVDRPITVTDDGSTAITVDTKGLVTIWDVGEDQPIATLEGDAAQPRWVSAMSGAMSASAVAPHGDRLALRKSARAQGATTWEFFDISIDSWIQRACAEAGRSLTPDERNALGLSKARHACV